MNDFIRFIFSFLYARNWFTGKHELSLPRVTIFAAMIFLVILGVIIVSILQSPVAYVGTGS